MKKIEEQRKILIHNASKEELKKGFHSVELFDHLVEELESKEKDKKVSFSELFPGWKSSEQIESEDVFSMIAPLYVRDIVNLELRYKSVNISGEEEVVEDMKLEEEYRQIPNPLNALKQIYHHGDRYVDPRTNKIISDEDIEAFLSPTDKLLSSLETANRE